MKKHEVPIFLNGAVCINPSSFFVGKRGGRRGSNIKFCRQKLFKLLLMTVVCLLYFFYKTFVQC